MSEPEFSRLFDVRQVKGKHLRLEPTGQERASLAARFGLVRIDRLVADLALSRAGLVVEANGTLDAAIIQACAVSGEDLAVTISEPLAFRFVPQAEHRADEELEVAVDDLDDIEFTGTMIDPGEAVAQSLALAIDPFAEGPGAEEARRRAGIVSEGAAGPFAALAALKK